MARTGTRKQHFLVTYQSNAKGTRFIQCYGQTSLSEKGKLTMVVFSNWPTHTHNTQYKVIFNFIDSPGLRLRRLDESAHA